MRLLAVLNPSAFDFEAERRWPKLEPRLARVGAVDVVRTLPDDDETSAALTRALQSHYDRVIAIGGDGTVHTVVNHLMEAVRAGALERAPELAVIPFGTANDIAKSFGLPLSSYEALADIAAGDFLDGLDVAFIEARQPIGPDRTRYFIDSVTVGMDADVVAKRQDYRELGGYLAYAAAMAERAVTQRSLDVRLNVDGKDIDLRVFNLIVNNAPVYAGEMVMPNARAGDGLLDVYAFNRNQYASKLISFAIKQADVLKTGINDMLEELTKNQEEHHGEDVRVRLASPRALQVDGELFGSTDEFHCFVASRLRVAVPEP